MRNSQLFVGANCVRPFLLAYLFNSGRMISAPTNLPVIRRGGHWPSVYIGRTQFAPTVCIKTDVILSVKRRIFTLFKNLRFTQDDIVFFSIILIANYELCIANCFCCIICKNMLFYFVDLCNNYLIIFLDLCIIYREIEWLRNQKGEYNNELFT